MAKQRNPELLRIKKAEQLLERTAQILNVPLEDARKRLCVSLRPSVRINPLVKNRNSTLEQMRQLGWVGEAVSWCKDGYTIHRGYETLRDSALVSEGKIYIQNEASWLPVVLLEPKSGESVLDVCAAPGGKTSHIAAVMGGAGELVANDNSHARLMKLRSNLKRLNVKAECTLYDATRLNRAYDGRLFDKILLDAPCSGEGLINLARPQTLDSWSVAHIRRLATLQKQILSETWKLLTPGGRLVYSTCTMAPEEDEMIIDWLLRRRPDATVVSARHIAIDSVWPRVVEWNGRALSIETAGSVRLAPGDGREAFFACAIEKVAA